MYGEMELIILCVVLALIVSLGPVAVTLYAVWLNFGVPLAVVAAIVWAFGGALVCGASRPHRRNWPTEMQLAGNIISACAWPLYTVVWAGVALITHVYAWGAAWNSTHEPD